MNFFNKLERKYGRYAIKDLMKYIIILYIIGWGIALSNQEFYLDFLALDVSAILHGQVWRLVTFIIMPPGNDLSLFVVFALYLYYILGINLERVWGAFRFNVYFFMGVLFHIIAAFLIYFVFGISMPLSTYYLNMSLFFAFACVYPDMELLLFFILPIKIKWLAMLDGVYFGLTIFFGFFIEYFPISMRYKLFGILTKLGIYPSKVIAVAALVSLLNFMVFFLMTRNYQRVSPREIKRKQTYKRQVNQARSRNFTHKCDICGRTNIDHPELSFRYCSKCSGNHEYCQDHLFTHEHVK